ncbi:MAG: hypothetical protein EON92_06520 [Burkholderiales bacterium]|nr:MAG: hypothetical protein EON92_06520 [Burkholderiales bacterium]
MHTGLKFLVCAGLIGSAVAAHAQFRYTCTINGRTVNSSSPCPSTTAPTYYGPPPAERSSSSYNNSYTPPTPRIAEAPPQMKYLSARCSSLNDALRTAPARGLKHDTIATMRKSYEEECREEEQEARERLHNDKYAKVKQRKEEEIENRKTQERTALQQQQCGESKRILNSKRARTDLTDGEKADLARFEENYKSRCG